MLPIDPEFFGNAVVDKVDLVGLLASSHKDVFGFDVPVDHASMVVSRNGTVCGPPLGC